MAKTLQDLKNEYVWYFTARQFRSDLGLTELDSSEYIRIANEAKKLNDGQLSFRNTAHELLLADFDSQDTENVNRLQQAIQNMGQNVQNASSFFDGSTSDRVIPITFLDEVGRGYERNSGYPIHFVDKHMIEQYFNNIGQVEPVAYVRTDMYDKRPTREAYTSGNVNAVQYEQEQIIREYLSFEDEWEPVYGWSGRYENGEKVQDGLRDIMTSVISKEDSAKMAKILDGHEIEGERARFIAEMLTRLRNDGYSISVKEPFIEDKGSQLSVDIGYNTIVRLYDQKEPQYTGRTVSGNRLYYWTHEGNMGDARAYIDEDFRPSADVTMSLINLATGKEKDTFVRTNLYSRKSFANHNQDVNKASYSIYRFPNVRYERIRENGDVLSYNVISKPSSNNYKNVAFASTMEADNFLRDQLVIAREAFDKTISFDTLNDAAQAISRANMMEIDQSNTNLIQKEARRIKMDAIAQANSVFDPKYINIQSALLQDLISYYNYLEEPTIISVQFNSIADEGVKQKLESALKDVHSLDDISAQDIRDAFMETNFGSFETGFNPGIVSELGQSADRPNLNQALEAAIKLSNYNTELLKGNNYASTRLKDHIVEFNPDAAKTFEELVKVNPETGQFEEPSEYDYQAKALIRIHENLTQMGIEPKELRIDDKGVIQYGYDKSYERRVKGKKVLEYDRIVNQIGQVFNGDEYGVIQTNFNSGENYSFIPSYTAHFIPGEDWTLENGEESADSKLSRLRVIGYEQTLYNMLDKTLLDQVQAPYMGYDVKNTIDNMSAASLNNLYHGKVNGFKEDYDYVQKMIDMRSEEELKVVTATLLRRVRFPNSYGDSAGTNFASNMEFEGFNEAKLIRENLRVLDEKWENVFDMYMTGSGKNQGIERYLVEGVKILPDGRVEKSDGFYNEKTGEMERDRTPMTKLPEFLNYLDNLPADRQMMALKQFLVAYRVTEKSNVLLANFNGWTYDDAAVVSKEFAEKNMVPDHHTGELRPLRRGDKLSDFGSNKGVISLIVDPDMDLELAKEKDLYNEVLFFKKAKEAGSNIDVISGGYSLLSRNNMGVTQMLREDGVETIVNPITGEVMHGAVGSMKFMVTDMTVDKKSHVYDADDLAKGKGRSISTLLLLNLQALGADAVIEEIYGNNTKAWSDWREYMRVFGCDLDSNGQLSVGFTPQDGEVRNRFKVEADKTPNEFLKEIASQGGFLELPFPLVYDELNEQLMRDPKSELVGNTKKYAKGALSIDPENPKGYAIPVLSSSLRRMSELADGTTMSHDITERYANIYKAAQNYIELEKEIAQKRESLVGLSGAEKANAETEIKQLTEQNRKLNYEYAQHQFSDIQNQIARKLDGPGPNGKYSHVRDKITSRKVADSATLVASPDPRLDINQISISSETATKLGVKEGDPVMGWRDPTWRTGAVRAFEIVIDDDVTGFAMNPLMDKSHDGDFDGDAYGFKVLRSEAAKQELKTLLSHGANILNKGDSYELNPDGSRVYPLFVNDGMDVATIDAAFEKEGCSDEKPSLLRQQITEFANKSDLTNETVQKQITDMLNTYTQKALRSDVGFAMDYVNLTNSQTVMTSLAKMVLHKAKGSEKALLECAKYDGVELEGITLHDGYNPKDARNQSDVQLVAQYCQNVANGGQISVVPGTEYPTKAWAGNTDRKNVQYAVGTKSDNTARPGSIMQKATAAFRNKGLLETMEIFYKPTQMTLQIKHDAKDAEVINQQFDNSGAINSLLIQGKHPETHDALTTSQFVSALGSEFNKMGLPYNPDHLSVLANAMSNENGIIRSLDQCFKEDTSVFNKLSFGGVENGGVKALVQSGLQGQNLFDTTKPDMDSKIMPQKIKDQTVKLARQDVLVNERQSLDELKLELDQLEQDAKSKLMAKDVTDKQIVAEAIEPNKSSGFVVSKPIYNPRPNVKEDMSYDFDL